MNNKTVIYKELLTRLDIRTLPEETQDVIITRLGNAILERANIAIATTLTEEEASHLLTLQETADIPTIFTYIDEKHPELDDIITRTSKEVIDEFMKA